MELLLHLGMQKTGSKAIQKFLERNADSLRSSGIDCALDLRGGIWHQNVFFDFSSETDQKLKEIGRRASHAILSFERAYSTPDQTIERLVSRCASARALLFCREPVAWANSLKNQVLKAHRTRIDDWRNFSLRSGRYAMGFASELHLLRWERFLGRQSIRVHSFSPRKNVVPEFIDWMGAAGNDALVEAQANNPNKALDAFGIRVLIEVKRQIAEFDEAAHMKVVSRCHERLGHRMIDTRFDAAPVLLNPDEIHDCETFASNGLARMFDRYACGQFLETEERGQILEDFTPSLEEREFADAIVRSQSVR